MIIKTPDLYQSPDIKAVRFNINQIVCSSYGAGITSLNELDDTPVEWD